MKLMRSFLVLLTIGIQTSFACAYTIQERAVEINRLLNQLPKEQREQFERQLDNFEYSVKSSVSNVNLFPTITNFLDTHYLKKQLHAFGINITYDVVEYCDFHISLTYNGSTIGELHFLINAYDHTIFMRKLWIQEKYRNLNNYKLGSKLFNFIADLSDYLNYPIQWTASPFDILDGTPRPEQLTRLLRFYTRNGGKIVQKFDHNKSADMKYKPFSRSDSLPDDTGIIGHNPHYA